MSPAPAQSDEIVEIDLHFLRKARGLHALGHFAMQDDGTCLISVPDDLEVRTFHIARLRADGSSTQSSYSVETLRKVEIGAGFNLHVGISDDALYGFRDNRKSRFLSDRRVTLADVSLSADGQKFAVAFSDLLASGWAVAAGTLDGTGRLLWTKDLSFTAARVAVDRAGQWIAVGGKDGEVQVWNLARDLAARGSWPVNITALASAGPDLTVFGGAGTSGGVGGAGIAGVIGVMDASGGSPWQTGLPGVPVDIACDETGRLIAAICAPPEQESRLILLGAGGGLQGDVELGRAQPTGVSVSANGEWIAVSLRDGTLAVFKPRRGAGQAQVSAGDAVARAQALADDKRFSDAAHLLRARLAAVPSDVAACEALIGVVSLWRVQTLADARVCQEAERWDEADRLFAAFLSHVPLDEAAAREQLQLRRDRAKVSFARGQAAVLSDDLDEAERHLTDALCADPLFLDARRALSAARSAARMQAERQGQADLRAGRFADAVAQFWKALELGANDHLAPLLREAQIGEALAEGNRLYQERQYAASAFHFKKVLSLAPDHAQAKQRLGYAQSLEQDTGVSDRFRRLE